MHPSHGLNYLHLFQIQCSKKIFQTNSSEPPVLGFDCHHTNITFILKVSHHSPHHPQNSHLSTNWPNHHNLFLNKTQPGCFSSFSSLSSTTSDWTLHFKFFIILHTIISLLIFLYILQTIIKLFFNKIPPGCFSSFSSLSSITFYCLNLF